MVNTTRTLILIFLIFLLCPTNFYGQAEIPKYKFKVMEYNVENLFDCSHDTLKEDHEYLPDGDMHWTRTRRWRKSNNLARAILMAGTEKSERGSEEVLRMPSVIGMCEVENDSAMNYLRWATPLRSLGYRYVMTESNDPRGIDVALMYHPAMFRLDTTYSIRVTPIKGMRPTRDILYARGAIRTSDEAGTGELHLFVVHSPSRSNGEYETRKFRMAVAQRLCQSVDSIYACARQSAKTADSTCPMILVMGDFNDYTGDASLKEIASHGLTEISAQAVGATNKKVRGTYFFQGEWRSLDHIFVSPAMQEGLKRCYVLDNKALLEYNEDKGEYRPHRFMQGPVMKGGFSDHLPLMAEFEF